MINRPVHGKVAIVTGAGRGMGRSIALTLAQAGVSVAIAARTASELESVQQEIEVGGGAALCVKTDMAVEAQIVHVRVNEKQAHLFIENGPTQGM